MTYFPLLVVYISDNKERIVNSPADIESGKAFKVLKTNVQEG